MALKCFFARKCYPIFIISDRESSFIREGNALKRLHDTVQKDKLVPELAPQGVKFKFKFSYTPNYQALVEQLHRIVKERSKRKLIKHKPTIPKFHNHLCIIKHILNSRPVSTIRTSSSDNFQTVDAFQLLTGRSHQPIVPPYIVGQNYFIEQLKIAKHVAKHLKFLDIQLTKLWNFFFESYFHALQKYTSNVDPTRIIKIDDVVLIKDPNIRIRGEYPIAIVVGNGHRDSIGVANKEDLPRVLNLFERKE